MNRRIERGIKEVDASTAFRKIQNGAILLDVRETIEIELLAFDVENILYIPLSELGFRLHEVPRDKEVIVGCRSGARSFQVTAVLTDQQYNNVINLKDGILKWVEAGLPVIEDQTVVE